MPPRDTRRPDRVAEGIRMEVATFLAGDVKDPRVRGALVTVTAVEVTRDLGHATVFVSIMGSDAERDSALEGLASTTTHLRARVGRALRLRVAPEITFRYDESVARAARIETLLASVRPTDAPGDGSPSGA
ncbi:MAG TPA: 30S ribosome-binding factor RbfA [Gemmatimonadaceae bacterium]|jgi:ribosome-binding factor A